MPESWESRLFRWRFNVFPAYRGTGGHVDYVADDFLEVRIRLPLSWRTRNVVGTIFGGSLYSSVDPIYMLMLMKILGEGYVVWDKAASIRFRKPGRSTLYATFVLPAGEVEELRRITASGAPVDRIYSVDLVDHDGVPHATVEKTIYVRKK